MSLSDIANQLLRASQLAVAKAQIVTLCGPPSTSLLQLEWQRSPAIAGEQLASLSNAARSHLEDPPASCRYLCCPSYFEAEGDSLPAVTAMQWGPRLTRLCWSKRAPQLLAAPPPQLALSAAAACAAHLWADGACRASAVAPLAALDPRPLQYACSHRCTSHQRLGWPAGLLPAARPVIDTAVTAISACLEQQRVAGYCSLPAATDAHASSA